MPSNPPSPLAWAIRTLADAPTHPLSPVARATPQTVTLPGPGGPVTTTIVASPSPGHVRLPAHLVACPACQRPVPVDMLADLRPLTAAQRAAAGWTGLDFVCDACREHADRAATVSHLDLVVAHGAPAAVLARVQAHQQVEQQHRQPSGRPPG